MNGPQDFKDRSYTYMFCIKAVMPKDVAMPKNITIF